MVATIKKGASKKEIVALDRKLNENSSSRKKFDANKFCGTVKFEEDRLKIQKELRNGWQ
jgi:hypothetical protein